MPKIERFDRKGDDSDRETESGSFQQLLLNQPHRFGLFLVRHHRRSTARSSRPRRSGLLLTHQRIPAAVAALLVGGGVALGRDDDGVLVHQLAGRVGEGRQRQVDPLHLALVHPLLVLLLQVSAPGQPDAQPGLVCVSEVVPTAGLSGLQQWTLSIKSQ